MTCDEVRDRLLALPDPRRPTAELRAHLAGCPGCAAVQAAAARIEAAVASLPVPSSSGAKAAFLARLAEPEPIITVMPTVRHRGGLADLIARVKWQHAAGLAAGVALAVGGGWLATRPPGEPPAIAAGPRHELLRKEVGHVVKLTKATTPAERVAVWTDVATDLRAELKDIHQLAQVRDMDALALMYQQAVKDGVLAQAKKLPELMPGQERADTLTKASKALADAEAEADRLLLTARPQATEVLRQMARVSKDGRVTLEKLARGEKS